MKQKQQFIPAGRILIFVATCLFYLKAAADWKQWRGPIGQEHGESKVPIQWSETKNKANAYRNSYFPQFSLNQSRLKMVCGGKGNPQVRSTKTQFSQAA